MLEYEKMLQCILCASVWLLATACNFTHTGSIAYNAIDLSSLIKQEISNANCSETRLAKNSYIFKQVQLFSEMDKASNYVFIDKIINNCSNIVIISGGDITGNGSQLIVKNENRLYVNRSLAYKMNGCFGRIEMHLSASEITNIFVLISIIEMK